MEKIMENANLLFATIAAIAICYSLGKIQEAIDRIVERIEGFARKTAEINEHLSRISDRLETMGSDEIAIKKREEHKEREMRIAELRNKMGRNKGNQTSNDHRE